MGLIDLLLLPKGLYHRLDNSRKTLYLGIFLVGIRDVILHLSGDLTKYFSGKTQDVILANLGVMLLFVLILGIVDVVCFSYPMFDLYNLMRRRMNAEGIPESKGSAVKIMKIYIIANLIITPIDFGALFFVNSLGDNPVNNTVALALNVVVFLATLWYFGVITRGVSTLYSFKGAFTVFVFITALLYSDLLNLAFNFISQKGLLVLLK